MTDKEKQPISRITLPFFQTVLGCYDIFFSKFWNFARLGGLFALLTTIVFFISGQETLCFNDSYSANHFCTRNAWNYILVHLLVFCISFVFMQKWVLLIADKQNFVWKRVFLPDKGTLKMIGLFFSYVCTVLLAALSLYLLYIRRPSSNWKIELVYFTFVSIGFLFPIFGMRFFSYFAYAAQRNPLPSFKTIWIKTSGNMLKIIGGCSFLLILALFLTQTVVQQTTMAQPIIMHALFIEYLSQLFVFVVLSCFMNYCYIQKDFLEKESEDERG